jgi:hypothetical protein
MPCLFFLLACCSGFESTQRNLTCLFGGQLISMNIPPGKEDRSYPYIFNKGKDLTTISRFKNLHPPMRHRSTDI